MAGRATQISDLTRRALVRATRATSNRARPDGGPLRFIFSIDTEISMGGALADHSLRPVGPDRRIWGITPDGAYGIDRFMDIFDEFGFRAVFFFETMAKNLVPESELAQAARHIAGRGHDVEMHVHPEFKIDIERVRSGEDQERIPDIGGYPIDEQRAMIRECADDIERWTGRRPVAFRAGGYGASPTTLRALALEKFFIDSSYNQWAVDAGFCELTPPQPLNDVATLDSGVLEIPVTNLRTHGPRAGVRPFELSSLNGSEMTATLDHMYELGYRTACGVSHSFRLLRAKDAQYRNVRSDPFNLHRLRVLCRHLQAHPERFQVVTYRDIPVDDWKRSIAPPTRPPDYPCPPTWTSISRLALQAIKDRGVR